MMVALQVAGEFSISSAWYAAWRLWGQILGDCATNIPPSLAWYEARELVLRYGWNTMAYQILNPGITLWFSHDRHAVVGYVLAGGYRVVAGAPISAEDDLVATVAQFESAANADRQRVCYFGAQNRIAAIVAATGRASQLLLGAQPIWDPNHWPAIIARKASLRAQIARARNKGIRVMEWPSDTATNHPELRQCLAEWLATRGLPSLHFLVEPETLARLQDRRVFVALRDRRVAGFLIATPIPQRNGWLIEQIVRGANAPNGLAELLVDNAMQNLAADGSTYVTLGLAPLSRHADGAESTHPLWVRAVLHWMRIHGQRFYNFDGLDSFKAKLQPDSWEPVYALTRERWVGARALYAITGAFGGESPIVFLCRALLRAASQEWYWFRQRTQGVGT